MDNITIRRALISVSDKTGVVEFAKALQGFGVEILSTGGTLTELEKAGVKVRSVSSVTGFPEIMDGRVKTLHPRIHGGLLGVVDNPAHVEQMREHGITPIDLLAVNLYPFEKTVAKAGVAMAEAVEQIDVGGPAMLRAAAKNFASKTVVTGGSLTKRSSSSGTIVPGACTSELSSVKSSKRTAWPTRSERPRSSATWCSPSRAPRGTTESARRVSPASTAT